MEIFLHYIFIFFLIIATIYFGFYLLVFSRFSFSKIQKDTPKTLPVSIIVCAKNELQNLQKNLPKLVNQDYPYFEIVVIDDASIDDSVAFLEQFVKENPIVRLVKVENNEAFWGNKKFALTLGIKAAKNEFLVFTDADCYPSSNKWLQEITSKFTNQKSIVLGYGAYEKKKGSFLNKLIRFETLFTAIQYFSYAKIGKPYMGVGRNLAYKKQTFFEANGFVNHMKIRSGDDDLFVNEIGNKQNIAVCITPESFTISSPKKTYKSWVKQKRRHVSTAKYYKTSDKVKLALFFIVQFLFFTLSIILLSFLHQWIVVTSVLFVRYVYNYFVIGYAAKKLQEKDLIIWYPILEVFLIFIHLRIFFTNLFSKPVHWK
jgi:glycosyltransferase involved in cell wall biosynthesis